MRLTEEELETIVERAAKRAHELVADSNPYDPKKLYQDIKEELARDLGEGALNQATWIVVNGVRALVVMALLAFAEWLFEIRHFLAEIYRSMR